MAENKIIDTFWDESPIDVTQEANFIWSIANKLRGSYMPDKYGDVIIPMTIIRRFECALAEKKEVVRKTFEKDPKHPPKALCRLSGFQFYNTSGYDLAELCNDADHIAENFKSYINRFSSNVQDILNELEINTHIDKMDKDGCLYSVVKAFSELDLSLETFDSIKMGYIFENLIGRFFQNVDAGQFYTGRDIIKLLVEILMSEGCDDIFDDGKVITVCDQACGTGGMLSTAYNYIKHYNPSADVRLFGQEYMGVSYAVGLAEMLIKNQNSENFRHTDTFKEDCFENIKMRFVIENPPFGTPWSGKDAKVGQEDAVRKEHASFHQRIQPAHGFYRSRHRSRLCVLHTSDRNRRGFYIYLSIKSPSSININLAKLLRYTDRHALDLQFLGIDIFVSLSVFIAGAEKIPPALFAVSERLQIVHALIQRNDNIANLRRVLLTDHNIITGMDSRIHHRLAFRNQRKEFALPDQRFRHADILDDFLRLFLTLAAGNVAKHGHGGVPSFHLYTLRADRASSAVFQLAVLFHVLETAVHGGNGDPRTCRDIAHGWDRSVVAVILIDVLNDRRFCFISDVFHGASNAGTLCFNNILT